MPIEKVVLVAAYDFTSRRVAENNGPSAETAPLMATYSILADAGYSFTEILTNKNLPMELKKDMDYIKTRLSYVVNDMNLSLSTSEVKLEKKLDAIKKRFWLKSTR